MVDEKCYDYDPTDQMELTDYFQEVSLGGDKNSVILESGLTDLTNPGFALASLDS